MLKVSHDDFSGLQAPSTHGKDRKSSEGDPSALQSPSDGEFRRTLFDLVESLVFATFLDSLEQEPGDEL